MYLLTNDGFHSCGILGSSIVSIELIGNWGMILSIFFNSLLHQTGERRKDIDWWVDLLIMELTINEDLTFCDVAC